MLAGYDKLKKLADDRGEMVIRGQDAEVMTCRPGLVATTYSKSVLRAVAGKWAETFEDVDR